MKKQTKQNLLILAGMIALITINAYIPTPRETALNASWEAFCETENIDPDNYTDADVDRYNDTWRGSYAEELALHLRDLDPDNIDSSEY